MPSWAGQLQIELAFIDEVSLVRASFVTEKDIDAMRDKNGNPRFLKHGIAVLDAESAAKKTGGSFRITPDAGWPPNAHVLFIRKTGGKNLKASHPEVPDLTDLANTNPLAGLPKP